MVLPTPFLWSPTPVEFAGDQTRAGAGGEDLTMKLPKRIAFCIALALLGAGLAGCQTHRTVTAMSSGYEEVSHPNHALFDEPPPPRISFQHRNADGTVTEIWPSLYGVGELFQDGLALFVGDKAYVEPDRVTHPRLFAVRSPDLPVDITDEVLGRWAKAAGKNFKQARDRFTMVTPNEKDGRVELSLEFSTGDKWAANPVDWPEQSTLSLDWAQVWEMMRAVKAAGVQKNDLRWHTAYIGDAF
jgi:hypothetical protein